MFFLPYQGEYNLIDLRCAVKGIVILKSADRVEGSPMDRARAKAIDLLHMLAGPITFMAVKPVCGVSLVIADHDPAPDNFGDDRGRRDRGAFPS